MSSTAMRSCGESAPEHEDEILVARDVGKEGPCGPLDDSVGDVEHPKADKENDSGNRAWRLPIEFQERRSYRALDYVSDIWQVGKARLEKKRRETKDALTSQGIFELDFYAETKTPVTKLP
ncbi:hypothetical protein STAS_04826 [Striga asiatica]|uniref:Uncharacterized protein n=1 Tax=Striga asiatica TaxID=4170 RepID=A0A5A7P8I9_STRAF|nr:hypothetical protein STAS_04826 [Striga asiatica]